MGDLVKCVYKVSILGSDTQYGSSALNDARKFGIAISILQDFMVIVERGDYILA